MVCQARVSCRICPQKPSTSLFSTTQRPYKLRPTAWMVLWGQFRSRRMILRTYHDVPLLFCVDVPFGRYRIFVQPISTEDRLRQELTASDNKIQLYIVTRLLVHANDELRAISNAASSKRHVWSTWCRSNLRINISFQGKRSAVAVEIVEYLCLNRINVTVAHRRESKPNWLHADVRTFLMVCLPRVLNSTD